MMKRFALFLALMPFAQMAQAKSVDCYCTDSGGARVELGESICLQVGGRMFTAQCQMSLNVPMWRETQNGCLSSELSPAVTPFDRDLLKQPVEPLAVDPQI